jgi:hypothetical protein
VTATAVDDDRQLPVERTMPPSMPKVRTADIRCRS